MLLKRCPHCMGTATLKANYSYKIHKFFVFVKCDICGAQGKVCTSEEPPECEDWNNQACRDAVEAWNMRSNRKGL